MDESIIQGMTQSEQMRAKGHTEWYAPGRDVTMVTPAMVHSALGEWDEPDNEYRRIIVRLGRNEREMERLAAAVADYFNEVELVKPGITQEEAYRKSGLADIPADLKVGLYAILGETLLHAFWYGIRTATNKVDGEFKITQYDAEKFVKEVREFAKRVKMPRWKRILYKWKKAITGG